MDLKEVGCGLDSTGSGQDPVADCLKRGNGTSGSKKGEFPDQLNDYQLLKKGSVSWS
jgi:hypothetical protein